MNRHSELLLIFLVVALSAACAEVVQWRACPNPDHEISSNCTIHEVVVEPCPEAAERKPCKLKRGVISNITIHYTPELTCILDSKNSMDCEPRFTGTEKSPPSISNLGNLVNFTLEGLKDFSASTAEGRMYWANQVMDIPFLGLDPNGCLATTCPIEDGQRNLYHIEVPILKKFPVRTYDLKWKLWNEEQAKGCCFLFQIKITK